MFFLLPRALVVVAVLLMLALAKRLYRQWTARIRDDRGAVPVVPARLLGDSDRTWVVFTTEYCATCGPVKERLSQRDPQAHVVTVDVGQDPALAAAFRIRSAPTVIEADRRGRVLSRLVGAEAVSGRLALLG